MKYLYFIWLPLVWHNEAHAYLDPGTGSIIIQSLIAIVAGALFTMKLYWHSFKAWLSRTFNSQSSEDEEDDKGK